MEHAAMDRLLSAAFHGGELKRRELRLSDQEAQCLAAHYPVRMEPLGDQWYLVIFEEAVQGAS